MKISNKYLVILLLICFFLLNEDIYSQCAMCRTTAESDLKTGGSVAKGLNKAILYLMAVPYLALMVGAYFFFKKSVDAKLKAIKTKYFSFK